MWSYKPDLQRTTPNIITSMSGLVPTSRGGWRPMYAAASTWTGGASGSTDVRYNGSFLAIKTDGSARLFLATSATGPVGKLWEVSGTNTLTDRSKGGNYTAGGASFAAFFSFCQLGDVTIAANKSDALQSSSSGAFADVSGSPPKAKFCVADANQVVLLNYNNGTDTPDGWWCSDVGTSTTWTPASTNEAKNGRLRDKGGAITSACAFPTGGVIAFKPTSCYIGIYVGQPKVREWRTISPRIGCPYPEGAIQVEDVVYFVGDDVYRYDGARVVSVTEGVRNEMRYTMSLYDRVALQYDDINGLLYVMFGNQTSANFSGYYALNVRTGEWGTGGFNDLIVGVVNCSLRDALMWKAGLALSSLVWETDAASPSYIKNLSTLSTVIPKSATTNDITWTLSYLGDPYKATTVQSITPIFTHGSSRSIQNSNGIPADVTAYTLAVTSHKFIPGGSQSSTKTATMNSSGRFDLLAQGNWHQATYTVELNSALTETFEWFDQVPEYVPAGKL